MPFTPSSLFRPIGLCYSICSHRLRPTNRSYRICRAMGPKEAHFRLCNVSSYSTELLEIHADEPVFHVLFIPGNPGVVTFYKDFLESLFEILGGSVSLTAVGHISHSIEDREHGRLFSLQDQIDQKVDFIKQELKNVEVPIILHLVAVRKHKFDFASKVGHSIGAYISIETFKRVQEKVFYCIGLYPFMALKTQSRTQLIIGKITKSSVVSIALSSIVGLLGLLPIGALKFVISQSLGKAWSSTAIEAGCSHLPKYHTMRNVLFMAMTEFEKLSEEPDWEFMRENRHNIAFLFGIDDHWGPLEMFEEISRQVPQIALTIEKEGHSHAFCCSKAGSSWVAHHVASLITQQLSRSSPSTNSK